MKKINKFWYFLFVVFFISSICEGIYFNQLIKTISDNYQIDGWFGGVYTSIFGVVPPLGLFLTARVIIKAGIDDRK